MTTIKGRITHKWARFRTLTVADYDEAGNLLGVEVFNVVEKANGAAAMFGTANQITIKQNHPMLNFLRSLFGGATYDEAADAAYIRTRRGKPYKQVEATKPVVLDIDRKGRVVGIEVQGVSKKIKQWR